MGFFGGMPFPVQFFLAFIVVLGLIGATAWAVRRFGGGRLGSVGMRFDIAWTGGSPAQSGFFDAGLVLANVADSEPMVSAVVPSTASVRWQPSMVRPKRLGIRLLPPLLADGTF